MSKISEDPRLPMTDDVRQLKRRLNQVFLDIARQLNLTSEGAVLGAYNGQTASPTVGTFNLGDFVRNTAPSELGTAGSKYLVTGWTCTVAGTPGTFVQNRVLTGN